MSFFKKLFGSSTPLGVSKSSAWSDMQDAMLEWRGEEHAEIKAWVENGGDVNWRCGEEMTLLHYAAMRGNLEIVEFLLAKGAEVNSVAKGNRTPLTWACANIETSVVPALIEAGADVNHADAGGYLPLRLLRRSGREDAQEMAQWLVEHGAEQIEGDTAPCSKCGAPDGTKMKERNVYVSLNGVVAEFPCPFCGFEEQAPLEAIDKIRGVNVNCPSCNRIAFIPPTVWCNTCGQGLSSGWIDSLQSSRDE